MQLKNSLYYVDIHKKNEKEGRKELGGYARETLFEIDYITSFLINGIFCRMDFSEEDNNNIIADVKTTCL